MCNRIGPQNEEAMSLKIAPKPPSTWGCREEQLKFPGILTGIEMTYKSECLCTQVCMILLGEISRVL